MFAIGDFSKLSKVPITALRYYDEKGLLRPLSVDPESGYRYYSAEQIPRLHRLLALKDLGFSLDQIMRVLDEGLSAEQLRGMFRLKQAEVQQRVLLEQDRLLQIEERLKRIEQEETMTTYEVRIKQVVPQLVASIRDIVPTYNQVGMIMGELYTYLSQFKAGGLGLAIWHDEGYKTTDVDAEAISYLKSPVPATDRVKVYELPGATMACVVHHGSYATLNQAYDVFPKWLETNGYRIIGPTRELYLSNSEPVRQDDESYVTEIQFPIAKI